MSGKKTVETVLSCANIWVNNTINRGVLPIIINTMHRFKGFLLTSNSVYLFKLERISI